MKKIKSKFIVSGLLLMAIVWMATDGNRFVKLAQSMEIFSQAYRAVNEFYVDETDPNLLMRNGIDSMLASIDPYTNYFSEYQMEKARINFKGFWDGVGFSVMEYNGKIVVSEVFEESAASSSEVNTGDELIAIDGARVKGKVIEDIEQTLHGKEGTQVNITLKKRNSGKEIDLNLTRSKIQRKNVPFYDMIDENTAYIVLTTFTERASENIAEALQELQKKHKPKQLIIDLRENGGGLLIEAVNICNIFVDKGQEIVSIKSKVIDWDKPFGTRNNPIDLNIPLIVLINERSASASEIVAGAIQDLDRGLLVGRKSFGKGLVQNVYDIGYNSKVKLTTARYYIPSGRCIQALDYLDGKGVMKIDTSSKLFFTKNGRKVSDGGGLSPDVFVLSNENSAVLKSLQNNKIIFDYANVYQSEHDSIVSAEKFQLSEAEFDEFLIYLKKTDIKYPIEAEIELDSTIAAAKKEGIYNLLKNGFDKISKQIETEKIKNLEKNRKLIKEALEEEIVSRYFFEKGKIQLRLRRDKDVQEAVKLFADEKRFKSLLSAGTK
jgi:carboxyl-terminal processing protease